MKSTKISWYKEPYVWMLIFFPLMAVIGGFVTLNLAINSNDGLVVDDYYKEGLEINKLFERDKKAVQYNLAAKLHFDSQHHILSVDFTSNLQYKMPEYITLDFIRRTQKGLDQRVLLKQIVDNTYRAELPDLPQGTWIISMFADDWRLMKSVYLPMDQDISL